MVKCHGITLLPQFLGMYRLSVDSEETYMLIMRNVFSHRLAVHRKYDLKVTGPAGRARGIHLSQAPGAPTVPAETRAADHTAGLSSLSGGPRSLFPSCEAVSPGVGPEHCSPRSRLPQLHPMGLSALNPAFSSSSIETLLPIAPAGSSLAEELLSRLWTPEGSHRLVGIRVRPTGAVRRPSETPQDRPPLQLWLSSLSILGHHVAT